MVWNHAYGDQHKLTKLCCIAGKFGGGKFGKLTLGAFGERKFGELINQPL